MSNPSFYEVMFFLSIEEAIKDYSPEFLFKFLTLTKEKHTDLYLLLRAKYRRELLLKLRKIREISFEKNKS